MISEAQTLDEYQRWNTTSGKAKMLAEDYIRSCDTIREQRKNWFIVFGQTGSGKTMLGRAIVKALIERPKPVRARAVKFYEMMQRLKSKSNAEDYGRILDRYTDCELLFIDDLLKEKATYGEMTEADIKHLFAVKYLLSPEKFSVLENIIGHSIMQAVQDDVIEPDWFQGLATPLDLHTPTIPEQYQDDEHNIKIYLVGESGFALAKISLPEVDFTDTPLNNAD